MKATCTIDKTCRLVVIPVKYKYKFHIFQTFLLYICLEKIINIFIYINVRQKTSKHLHENMNYATGKAKAKLFGDQPRIEDNLPRAATSAAAIELLINIKVYRCVHKTTL